MSQPTEPTEADQLGLVEILRASGSSVLVAAADEIVRLRALVGGRPAAPSPERLYEVISDALTQSGGSHVLGSDVARARNAVVALLSRSAAEPPREPQQRLVANRLADELRDMAAQGRARGITDVRLVQNAADELERLVIWLEDARGVAAEPKEHGDA